jgi:polyisoprenoid-binding protein YceI
VARYRVREQLANVSLPSDAVGRTSAVSGAIVINADGSIASDQSKVSVDITGLKSDRSQRDRYLQNNVLQTSKYPAAEFVPTSVTGLPSPLPTSGAVAFQLTGDLTVHGVTKSVTWDVTATAADGKDLTGTATTSFTFADFGLTQPRVPVVLSVEDTIRLELDFHMVKAN